MAEKTLAIAQSKQTDKFNLSSLFICFDYLLLYVHKMSNNEIKFKLSIMSSFAPWALQTTSRWLMESV